MRIYGDDAPSRYLRATLKDAHVRDEHNVAQYRMYRGARVPVYKAPHGFGLLEKVRGEARWTAWLNVLPRTMSDMLILLGSGKQLYIALQEAKQDRARWVRSFSLQTADPTEE